MRQIVIKIYTLMYVVFLLLPSEIFSQFSDDFSDGDLSINPAWYGNTEDFITNSDYQLQLDAFEAGNSLIFTKYNIPDSIEWKFYFKMDFSPSVSNKLRVYLMVDTTVEDKANGYFLEIGENGSNDNIKLYKTIDGESSLLGEGTIGLFADSPAEGYIKIQRRSDNMWKIFYKTDNSLYQNDFEVFDDDFNFKSGYFMIKCYYSSTRKDKFTFDDISALEYEADKQAPKLISASLIDENTLQLNFDEQLDEISVLNYDNYKITDYNSLPDNILFDEAESQSVVKLVYQSGFESGREYEITISGIEDLYGNISSDQSTTFYILDKPELGDIVINEVLFNPNTGGSDFVEILNKSKKILNLQGLWVFNQSSGKRTAISDKIVIKQNEYICLTEDTLNIINNYFVPDSVRFIEMDLPSFNDDEGNVSLQLYSNPEEYMNLDSFDYNENMHSEFLDDVEGISLERINPDGITNDKYNWSSASLSSGGATPGYKNSDFYIVSGDKSGVYLRNKIFSPDNDGYEDELIIEYNLEKENSLMNCKVIDFKGRSVIDIMDNITLGKSGIITWDGYKDGKILSIGIYLLYYNIVDINGNKMEGKLPFILAQKLN
ncbi:MAG: hypothetical protein R2771_15535 [Saprospiraceae bacterium]